MNKILIVEDDNTIAKNLSLLLTGEGYAAMLAGGQKQAIDALDKAENNLDGGACFIIKFYHRRI